MAGDVDPEVATRARAWRTAALEAVCDVMEPWTHGTVARATRYPNYFDFNLVRVEDDPGMDVDELVAFADRALAGLVHRRIDFDVAEAADSRRAAFEGLGWTSLPLVWMRYERESAVIAYEGVEEVSYDDVHELRLAWYAEDHPDQIAGGYHDQARDVAMMRRARVLATYDAGRPVAFAQVEHHEDGAEITQVYVHPDHRGEGQGTGMTIAAIAAAGDVRDLWIAADDEGRPKQLYARLGFRPAWRSMEITRWPGPGD